MQALSMTSPRYLLYKCKGRIIALHPASALSLAASALAKYLDFTSRFLCHGSGAVRQTGRVLN